MSNELRYRVLAIGLGFFFELFDGSRKDCELFASTMRHHLDKVSADPERSYLRISSTEEPSAEDEPSFGHEFAPEESFEDETAVRETLYLRPETVFCIKVEAMPDGLVDLEDEDEQGGDDFTTGLGDNWWMGS